jgi:2-dehydro-3-deoxyglucarate aldolase
MANEIEIYAQIESIKGLKNCREIFSQNINGYFIGPYDLSASLNNPGVFDSDEFSDA